MLKCIEHCFYYFFPIKSKPLLEVTHSDNDSMEYYTIYKEKTSIL